MGAQGGWDNVLRDFHKKHGILYESHYDAVRSLYKGRSIRAVAKMLGVGHTRVYRALIGAGVERRDHRVQLRKKTPRTTVITVNVTEEMHGQLVKAGGVTKTVLKALHLYFADRAERRLMQRCFDGD